MLSVKTDERSPRVTHMVDADVLRGTDREWMATFVREDSNGETTPVGRATFLARDLEGAREAADRYRRRYPNPFRTRVERVMPAPSGAGGAGFYQVTLAAHDALGRDERGAIFYEFEVRALSNDDARDLGDALARRLPAYDESWEIVRVTFLHDFTSLHSTSSAFAPTSIPTSHRLAG